MGKRSVLTVVAGVAALAAIALAGGLATASSGEGYQAAPSEADQAATQAFPVPNRAVLRLVKTRFGRVIHEKNSGLVAYLFTRDRKDRSRCYGACAKAWPPVKTRKRPVAGSGLQQKHLRTISRRGGGKMVSYRGKPLYFYEDDSPGVILCHDVFEFGGDWLVVKKNGKPA